MTKPSASQEAAIKHFAGVMAPAGPRVTEKTYEVCRTQGWIEPTDAFPFHRVTAAGRAAIGLPTHERHGTCGNCFGGVHEYPAGWAHVIAPLQCAGLVPTRVH